MKNNYKTFTTDSIFVLLFVVLITSLSYGEDNNLLDRYILDPALNNSGFNPESKDSKNSKKLARDTFNPNKINTEIKNNLRDITGQVDNSEPKANKASNVFLSSGLNTDQSFLKGTIVDKEGNETKILKIIENGIVIGRYKGKRLDIPFNKIKYVENLGDRSFKITNFKNMEFIIEDAEVRTSYYRSAAGGMYNRSSFSYIYFNEITQEEDTYTTSNTTDFFKTIMFESNDTNIPNSMNQNQKKEDTSNSKHSANTKFTLQHIINKFLSTYDIHSDEHQGNDLIVKRKYEKAIFRIINKEMVKNSRGSELFNGTWRSVFTIYPNQELIIVPDKTPDDIVYFVTKSVFENLDELNKLLGYQGNIILKKRKMISESILKVQDGAKKYYIENNLWPPKN